jgi:hypothetical protein
MDVESFLPGQESGRKARPAPASRTAGHGESMNAQVEATQERLANARQAPSGVAFSGWILISWPRKR